jgi:hypothetical protein
VTTTGASYSPTGAAGTTKATNTATGTTLTTSTSTGSTSGCTVAKYGQCGGSPWTGCTVCVVCNPFWDVIAEKVLTRIGYSPAQLALLFHLLTTRNVFEQDVNGRELGIEEGSYCSFERR